MSFGHTAWENNIVHKKRNELRSFFSTAHRTGKLEACSGHKGISSGSFCPYLTHVQSRKKCVLLIARAYGCSGKKRKKGSRERDNSVGVTHGEKMAVSKRLALLNLHSSFLKWSNVVSGITKKNLWPDSGVT